MARLDSDSWNHDCKWCGRGENHVNASNAYGDDRRQKCELEKSEYSSKIGLSIRVCDANNLYVNSVNHQVGYKPIKLVV